MKPVKDELYISNQISKIAGFEKVQQNEQLLDSFTRKFKNENDPMHLQAYTSRGNFYNLDDKIQDISQTDPITSENH